MIYTTDEYLEYYSKLLVLDVVQNVTQISIKLIVIIDNKETRKAAKNKSQEHVYNPKICINYSTGNHNTYTRKTKLKYNFLSQK